MNHFRAFWRFFFDKNGSFFVKAMFLASLVYLFVPTDMVPDFIPIFGWLDDIGMFAVASAFVGRSLRPYLQEGRGAGAQADGRRSEVVETTGVTVR